MRLMIKAVLFFALLGAASLLAFAIFSDLPAPSREIKIPVEAK